MKKFLCVLPLLLLTGCGTRFGSPQSTDASTASSKYSVRLAWDAPGGSVPAVRYNVYRKLATGTDGFAQINTSAVAEVTYTDKTVQLGARYTYVVGAVDAAGAESDPSNTATVTIPSQ